MAKEEKKTEETAEANVIPEKKGGMKKWIVIGVVILALLGGGGFAAWKFLIAGGEDSKAGVESREHEGPAAAPGPMVALDSFLVNLADPADSHYLKVTVNLELEAEKTAGSEEVQQRMPQIRDSILVLLSSKSAEDVRTVEGKFRLRDEIISRVNKFLSQGKVKGAYFTEFVMQ